MVAGDYVTAQFGKFTVLAEIVNQADHAYFFLFLVFRVGDVFAYGIFIAEKVSRKFAVDNHWSVTRAVVLLAEPSAADHLQAQYVLEIIGHRVPAEFNRLSCFFVIAAARPIAA